MERESGVASWLFISNFNAGIGTNEVPQYNHCL
jgi:hypothetical protein